MSNKVILTVKQNNNKSLIINRPSTNTYSTTQNIKLPSSSPSPLINYYTKEETNNLLDNKLDILELNNSINKALKEAKDSGQFDGKDGLPGPQGPVGPQGMQGEQGIPGMDGKDGKDGEKPIKGEDYFTEQEKQDFIDDITEEITPTIKDKVEEIIGDVDLDGNASSIVYDSSMAETHDVTNVKDALDKLLNKVYYTAVSISSFSGGGTYEIGNEIRSINFAWALNKNPLSIAIKQGTNVVANNLSVDSRSYTYTPTTAIKSNTTFTLTCEDVTDAGVATNRTKDTSLVFLNKIFYNTVSGNTPTSQAGIVSLGVSGNTTKTHWSNSNTITHAFKGKKFCIALPSNKRISKAVTSNNETITDKFVSSNEIDYTIGTTTTKYKVHTFEVAAEMNVTLTLTLA